MSDESGRYTTIGLGIAALASLSALFYVLLSDEASDGKGQKGSIMSERKRFQFHRNISIGDNLNSLSQSTESWTKGQRDAAAASADSDMHADGHISGTKLVIVMVGFPGRGKTFISRKIARYLRWINYRTRVFSIAKYRLDKLGNRPAEFFDPHQRSSYQQRVDILTTAVEDALRYLERGGQVVIIDGTNTTRDRRDLIRGKVQQQAFPCQIIWIESICESEEVMARNTEELSESPDYNSKLDYEKRLAFYTQSYEKLEDEEGSFIKVYDSGRKLDLHMIHGFLKTKIVSFVMNLHTFPRQVYLTRHGESEYNEVNLLGGDSGLTEKGFQFSEALGSYFSTVLKQQQQQGFSVWTSLLLRAKQTIAHVSALPSVRITEWRSLRDLEVGVCDGLTYDQVKARYPEEYLARSKDKLRYRYPRGESYVDLIARLEPVIFEIERQQEPLLIVAHQAVLRCLYAYFLDVPHEGLPFLSIPLHTVIRVEPKALGCIEKRLRFELDESSGK